MKRRTSLLPVRVFTFGCSHRGITGNKDLADQQYRLAHIYREKLVDLELARRAAVRAALAAVPDVAGPATAVETIANQLQAQLIAQAAVKKATRSARVPADLVQRIRDLRAALKTARDVHKAAKQLAAGDPAVKAQLAEAETAYRDAIRAGRRASGLYWGTYLIVEKAAEQQRNEPRDPRHRPYTGEGRIAVQLQKGLPASKLLTDTRLQIVPFVPPRKAHLPPPSSERRLCRLRIGSAGAHGRTPAWAEIEITQHRPFPDDARITWAWLQRVRQHHHSFEYRLQVVIESAAFAAAPPQPGGKRIAVDLGWRVAEKGAAGLRVAYWRDDRGDHGELRVPPALLAVLDYPNGLVGVADHHFEKAKAGLLAWCAGRALPDEHAVRLQTLAAWKSGRRLAWHVRWWKDHRFAGDEEILAAMEEWRVRRFWHYMDWAADQRSKALNRRLDFYRVFAARQLVDCTELVLEDFDLRAFSVLRDDVPTAQRYWRMMGAPSGLRQALISAADARGITVTKVDPAHTTQRCASCGVLWTDKDRSPQHHTCTGCGARWDQDDNACINLLRASGPVAPPKRDPLDKIEAVESAGDSLFVGAENPIPPPV